MRAQAGRQVRDSERRLHLRQTLGVRQRDRRVNECDFHDLHPPDACGSLPRQLVVVRTSADRTRFVNDERGSDRSERVHRARFSELLASEGHEVTGFIGRSAPPRSSAARHIRVDLGTDSCRPKLATRSRMPHVVAHLAAARKDWGLDRAAASRINVRAAHCCSGTRAMLRGSCS
jgi:hypothetical protein